MLRLIVLLLSVVACLNVSASNNLTLLSDADFNEWEPQVFSGKSIYTQNEYKGRKALQAISNNAASGLVLKKKIDLSTTPYINWSWLVEKQLLELDERSKSGDDFVARVYVVIDGGFKIWQTKSLSYVWSSNQEKDVVWDNAFAGSKVKMMSIKGKDAKIGQWHEEKRNVYKDLIDVFGDQGSEAANLKTYKYIDVIAIMTDTDNSGQQAESYYGNIEFSAK